MDAPAVRYARTSDGFEIGYAVSGQGRPIVLMPWSLQSEDPELALRGEQAYRVANGTNSIRRSKSC